ncbi:LysR family transcriptional regulator [Aeromonas veronii]|uniref:LysR family transcriptional regulator n=1 Tax=Aeromonas veronii TaxID=654 RepID=UPI003D1D2F15
MSQVDLNLFRVLDAVIRYGGVTTAAEMMEMTPSAISQAISRLTTLVGEPLFVRQGRGITPTARALSLHHEIMVPLPPRQIAYESDSLLTALHLVSRTDWLCVASQWHMEKLGQALDLASYPLPWLSEDCPVYMSWHKSSGQDTGLNWLKDQVRAVSSF